MRVFFLLLLGLVLPGDAGSLWVAVGYGGRRLASTDGRTWWHEQRWSDGSRDDDHALLDVTYGLGRFLAVGGGEKEGHILSTLDGRAWTALPVPAGRVATVAFGRGRFIAAQGPELLCSTDGAAFARGARLGWEGHVAPRRSACGDTEAGFRTVIIGELDLPGQRRSIAWRAATGDGSRWLHQALETPPARDIAYGAGRFVVVGPAGLVESSHDGQTWQRHVIGEEEDFERVVWTGAAFFTGGGRKTWTSRDAVLWQPAALRSPGRLAWLREPPGLALALSWGGSIQFSTDRVTWRPAGVPPGPALTAIAAREP